MKRKIIIMLLSLAVCLLGKVPVLAQADYPYVWAPASDSDYKGEHRWSYATPEEYEKLTGKKIEKYNESPMLRTKVAAGELPPVEERLPEEPLVLNPYEEIGEYGGIVHVVAGSAGWSGANAGELNESEPLLRCEVPIDLYGARPRPNVPNVAKGWELSKDFRTITLHLRKGIKWSDGVPFTADDIVFWYEDVLKNKDLTPGIPRRWKIGGKVWELKKIDDYTIRLDFAAPNPWILYLLATWGPEVMCQYPKHYLKEFHIKYNPKANELAKKEGLDHWYQLFAKKSTWRDQPSTPTISPYVLKERTTTYFFFERNPYYWKVDPEGNQLPYFDGIYAKVVADVEMAQAKIVTGEVDFTIEPLIENYPLYMENAERGNYRLVEWTGANRGTFACFSINQTCKDPVLRDIFRDVRFRRALSLAIDREEINDVFFFGKGVPRAETVVPISMFYEPEFEKAYAEYDPEKANALLDEMGLKWDEDHKYRLRPDGKRLSIIVDVFPDAWEGVSRPPIAEMIARQWKAIGIDASIKTESIPLCSARVTGNEYQLALVDGCSASDDNFIVAPHHFVLWNNWMEGINGPWVVWYLTEGKKGEKPPEELIRVTKEFEKLKTTVDEKERIRLGKDILRSNAENLWTIGTVGLLPIPCPVRNNLRNIPEKGPFGVAGTWSIDYFHPEQFFFKHPLLESQKH